MSQILQGLVSMRTSIPFTCERYSPEQFRTEGGGYVRSRMFALIRGVSSIGKFSEIFCSIIRFFCQGYFALFYDDSDQVRDLRLQLLISLSEAALLWECIYSNLCVV